MNRNYINNLNLRLSALTVFRNLLDDSVIKLLRNYLSCIESDGAVSAYAEFVSAVYKSKHADLALHIKDITDIDENVYIQLIGCGKNPDVYIKTTVLAELETLQSAADITPDIIKPETDIFLPEFSCTKVNLAESYMQRVKNISKYGYGIYARNSMFYVDPETRIVPAEHPDPVSLENLICYERERGIILNNTYALLEGKPAANILLTGDAGTGKSSTVKAIVNKLFSEGLRIIEIRKNQLAQIPEILDRLAANPLKFILFIDDLSFHNDDDSFNVLKAVLEGSVSAKSNNVVIYATSNRRHIIKEKFSAREGDDIHRNDTMQEMISLSERFGIHVTFQKPDKATFLHIVHQMAKGQNISINDDEIDMLAERFALERGGRTPRLAKQFVDSLLSQR